MCGIVGIGSTQPISEQTWLTMGRDKLLHRGPDDAGEWWSLDRRVGLAHRRLAIIDLSSAGHQPMTDSAGRCVITFNGEIYNFQTLKKELIQKGYVFRSNSDTEVILAAYLEWGTDCLRRLNGMFAFALFDQKKQILLLARDRAGEKPLFYTISNGTLKFASELKALMADPNFSRQIDPVSLDCYLAFRYVPDELCILQGVKKLPPAHALIFDLNSGKSKKFQYWQLPELENPKDNNLNELVEELEELFTDAVRRQLIADVPIGILLSGGIDSSIVTALAARHVSQVKTFTIRFPGYRKYDETEYARLVAKYFSTDHITLDASEYTIELLPLLAKQFDEPIVDSSMIPTYMVCQLVKQHCKVALGGDGGDELFGGYTAYTQLIWVTKTLANLPLPCRKLIAWGTEKFLPVGVRGKKWLLALDGNFKNSLPITSYFDPTTRKKLFAHLLSWKTVAEKIKQGYVPQGKDIIDRMTRMDFKLHLTDDILVKVDRCSMLNSLEVRAPFLDYRIIEFAFKKVPSHFKTTLNQRKIVLKALAHKLLPPQLDLNRKQGFSIPISKWLKKGRYRDFFYQVLTDPKCIFNPQIIKKLFQAQDRGLNVGERLFALVLLELWRREYNVSL